MIKRLSLFVAAMALMVGLVGVLFTSNITAQGSQASGLRITPIRHEFEIEPGGSEAFSVTVRNVTNATTVVSADVIDFEPNEVGQPQLIFDAEPTPYSLKNFVLGLEQFTLKPGAERELDLIVTLPSDVPPGALFGAIGFSALPPDQAAGDTPVALAASLSSLLLIQVPGDVVEQMSLIDLSAGDSSGPGSFFSSAPTQVLTRLRNEGTGLLKPFGQVLVKDWSGNIVHEFELNDTAPRGNVLPQSERVFVDALENIGSIGRYTIEANISYGEGGGNIITATSSFWVIPWIPVTIVLVLGAALIFGAVRGLHVYRDRIIASTKTQKSSKK